MNDYTGMSGFGMGFSWIIPIVFILILIYFINNLFKSDSSAKDILDKRYVNGEIDEKEYRTKREELHTPYGSV